VSEVRQGYDSSVRAAAARARFAARHLRGAPAARRAARSEVSEIPASAYHALLHRLYRGCRTQLDVGTGVMASLRDSPVRVRVGLDAHRPYLENRRVRDAVPLHADALRLDELFVPDAVDLVTLHDVIEHFPEDEARALLGQAEAVAAVRVVLSTPRGEFPQAAHDPSALGGDELQRHRSAWDVGDLTSLGYHVAIVRELHTAANLQFVEAFGADAPPVDGLIAWKDMR
jgi:hypothetical protein